jgi:O-antigen/teichoic acid export membrane protein
MRTENEVKTASLQNQDRSDKPGSGTAQTDLTGRDRLASNVLFMWGSHAVFIAAGFILPRMIDRHLGPELLGVWDFCWSLVTYFQLVQIGVASSVNRYVATCRAAGDAAGMNRIASSAVFLLGISGLLVMGLTLGSSLLLPAWFGNRLGPNVNEAQWVVLFLGGVVCAQVSSSGFSGILTGCHRWEVHNINRSGWHALTITSMIIALLLGRGLRTLAVIMLVGEVLSDVRLYLLAHRVCEGLRVRLSLVRRQTIRDLFVFGGKTLIPGISKMLLDQTTSMLVLASLGPVSLAVFSRPRSLVYQLDILVRKMAMTLVPVTSSLQGTGDTAGIRDLVIKSTRYAFYMAMPMVLVLVFFGGPVMRLWMGSSYADGLVPGILAAGYLAVLVQLPALSVLAGLNAHGRAGVGRLVASLCSVGLNVLVLKHFHWGLVGTAVAVSLPLTILNAVDIPLLLCRRVGLSYGEYLLSVVVWPVLHMLPFAACLVATRLIFPSRPLTSLLAGGTAAAAALAIVYWRCVLPDRIKSAIVRLPAAVSSSFRFREVPRKA